MLQSQWSFHSRWFTPSAHPSGSTLIRKIPSTLAAGSFEKTGTTPQLRENVVYNGTTEYTETNTVAETVEAVASTTKVKAKAEVVVVLT